MVVLASFSDGGGRPGSLADEFVVTWHLLKTAPRFWSWRRMAALFGVVTLSKTSSLLVSLFHLGATDSASCQRVAWGYWLGFQ
jgi:hypothetical protein